MRLFSLAVTLALVLSTAVAVAADPFPFFAYCIDTHDSRHRTLPEQAAMLKELGFDGVGHLWLNQVQERLDSLDAAGLKLFQITIQVNIAPDKPAYDPQLKQVLPLLKGRDVQLCLLMDGMPASDVAGDARATAIVQEIADLAKESGTTVLLYPHVNVWLERVEDAIRLIPQIDRPNVGIMFNLCHWLKLDEEANLEPVLKKALPWLRAVSINGTDTAESVHAGTGNWLQPLDSGSYDVFKVVQALKTLGYRGPIGLQCWGIEGDARDHLDRSMKAWKKLMERLSR